ncbi:MAG: hypothetical protein LBC37_01735 [Zoogloeaceae bacterium]|jgi:hypothetical protein|nr:hypothetical protein [Zoogloeaceae bacterium]
MTPTTTPGASAPNPLDNMADEEINAMPSDDFADALFARMEAKEAFLTCEDMDKIEATWKHEKRSRRASLLILTKPWAWLNQKAIADREFALAIAEAWQSNEENIQFYKGLVEAIEQANIWAMTALCGREDMNDLLEEVKKGWA